MSTSRFRSLRSTGGFTIVEVLAALMMVLLVLGALALFFANNNDSSLASQREISQLSVLQQQIERVRDVVSQYGFGALALNAEPSAPSASPLPNNPKDPNDFITGYGTGSEAFLVENNYNNAAEGVLSDTPSTGEPLLDPNTGAAGGQISPLQCVDLATGNQASCGSLASGSNPYATVYTYITQTSTVGCAGATGSCSGDARRVIVAAVVQNPVASARRNIGPNTPTYSTTVITNPVASDQSNQASGLRFLGYVR
jgi:type II secretory pathway pseudopilin PulG